MAVATMGPGILDYIQANAGRLVLALGLILASRFFYLLFQVRLFFHRLRKQGLPVPAYSYGAGNLLTLPDFLARIPKGAQQSNALTLLSYEFPEFDNCFYIDLWPFAKPLLVITSSDLAVQACQTYALPKPSELDEYFHPFTGGPNIFTTNGPEWKKARSLFQPAFGNRRITKQVPHIVDEVQGYVEVLRDYARNGETFSLKRVTCDLLMDIIGSFTLNDHLNSQRQHNDLAAAMRALADWHVQDEEWNPFVRWNPMRYIVEWYSAYKMSQYIENALDKRYEAWKNTDSPEEPESMMDLAIADFMQDRPTSRDLDPDFKKWATIQIRTFFFAGHDSTAATIVYCLYLLSKRPEILAQVRAEHDQTFGVDISTTAQQLRERPELTNQLPLTTAVIKEVLRLYPPASALRGGMPGVYLEDKNGLKFPTEGLLVWIVHGAIQRNPNYWPEPHSFIPERWLVNQDHHLYPPKHAFRPFEAGPRDCFGQSLAMVDIKVALALTLREFDFHDQYAEWDRKHPGGSGPKTVFGERAYQVPQGAAQPVHGMPCRVVQRQQAGHV